MTSNAHPTRRDDDRRKFSLLGLFVLTLGLAAGLAELRWLGAEWEHLPRAMLLAISVWMILGLLAQSRDWRRASRVAGVSADLRFGLYFGAFWRVAAAILLAGYHVQQHLDANLFLDGRDDLVAGYSSWPIDIVYFTLLLVVVGSVRQLAWRRRTRTTFWRAVMAWSAGGVYCSIVVFYNVTIAFLVYLAISEIELATGTRALPFLPNVDPDVVGRAAPGFWVSCACALLIPVTLSLAHASARSGRAALALLTALILLLQGALLSWNVLVGLPRTAPLMMEGAVSGNALHFALIAAPTLLIVSLALARRWSRRRPDGDQSPQAEARLVPDVGPYLHERRPLLATLAATLAGPWFVSLFAGDLRDFSGADMAWAFLSFGTLPAELGIFLLATGAALAGWRRRGNLPAAPAPQLPVRRFLITWLFILVAMTLAIPSLAIYGFALWLAPWYIG